MESHSLVAADFLLIQKSLALKVRKQSLQLIFNEMGVSVKVESVYTSCVARQLIEFSLNRIHAKPTWGKTPKTFSSIASADANGVKI